MHWIFSLLLLSPFFVAQVTIWEPIALLFLLMTGPLNITLGTLGGWRMWIGFLSLALAIECMLRNWWPAGIVFVLIIPSLLFFRRGRTDIWRILGVVYCTAAASATAISPILAQGLLPNLTADAHSFEPYGMLLALWWLAPGIIVNLLSCLPPRWLGRWNAVAILLLALVWCAWIGTHPGSVFGLTTISAVATVVLAAGSLVRSQRVRLWRHGGAYAALILVCIGCWHLGPRPSPGAPPQTQRSGESQSANFDVFYRRWLAQRGETPEQHGPLLLVAVAGGGVRAAAHATISLSVADDMFKGKFGDRTLAISAVSGGALGVATWLGQRLEHTPDATVDRRQALTTQRLVSFYRHDFVSPTINRLLTHDLPLALSPWQISDRDAVLANSWAASWRELRGDSKGVDIFERRFSELSADSHLPAVMFNATSAADGRPALYASVTADFPDAWLLDNSVAVKQAVVDSARFAVVSPIGHRCALREGAPPLHSKSTPVDCKENTDPIAVADGGYYDNSGLASLEAILDKLEQYDKSLSNVYLVVIRSNPEIGLQLDEGKRFDNGRVISELLAPFSVLESARSARGELYAGRWQRRLGEQNVMTWDLDFARVISHVETSSGGPWPFAWLNERYNEAENLRRLQLAPLGWTMDRESFRTLHFESVTMPQVPHSPSCENLLPQFAVLCKVLPTANRQANVK